MATRLALIVGLMVAFAITVLILNQIMPGPHRPTDYLVMGTMGTLVCLIGVFLFTLTSSGDTFHRRRK